MNRAKLVKNIGTYFFLGIISLIIILPILHIVLSAFKTNAEIARMTIFPGSLYLNNFKTVFENPYTLFAFFNSLILVAVSLFLIVMITSLASYGLSRRKEKIFTVLYIIFLMAMIIPAVSSMVPLYKLIASLSLMDTRFALILIYTTSGIPMGILMFTSFTKTVPVSLDEAAMIEGCSYLTRFYKIIFPLLRPITASLIIMRLPAIWNDFMMPLLFIRDQWKKPITLVVYAFSWEHQQDFGAIFALLVMAMIPPIVFFMIGQRNIYKAIAAGAVKS